MNPSFLADTAAAHAAVASSGTSTSAAATGAGRLAHLFRASLREGRMHPLYLPMLSYLAAKTRSEPAAG